MEILERPYGMRAGFAPLDNIGFCLLEVNLEGEVYTYSIPGISEHCEVERYSTKCTCGLGLVQYKRISMGK